MQTIGIHWRDIQYLRDRGGDHRNLIVYSGDIPDHYSKIINRIAENLHCEFVTEWPYYFDLMNYSHTVFPVTAGPTRAVQFSAVDALSHTIMDLIYTTGSGTLLGTHISGSNLSALGGLPEDYSGNGDLGWYTLVAAESAEAVEDQLLRGRPVIPIAPESVLAGFASRGYTFRYSHVLSGVEPQELCAAVQWISDLSVDPSWAIRDYLSQTRQRLQEILTVPEGVAGLVSAVPGWAEHTRRWHARWQARRARVRADLDRLTF